MVVVGVNAGTRRIPKRVIVRVLSRLGDFVKSTSCCDDHIRQSKACALYRGLLTGSLYMAVG